MSPSQQVPSNEIIESSSLSLSQNNLTECGPSTKQESPKNKWQCPTCTYLNQMRSTRCAQCCTKRETTAEATNNLPDQVKALSIRGSDPELNSLMSRTSPMGSANSPYGSRTNLGAVGTRISPVDQKSYCSGKWICLVSAGVDQPRHEVASKRPRIRAA